MSDNIPQQVVNVIQISEHTLRAIIQESVTEAMTLIGIKSEDPVEMQADFRYLREWRLTMEKVREKNILTLVHLFWLGVITLVILGARYYFSSKGVDVPHGPNT